MVIQSLHEVINLNSDRAKKEERKNRIIAFAISTITHILILLILLYFGFKAPDPPLDTISEGGVAVILGTTETGMNETFEQVSKPELQPETEEVKPQEEDILTEESADVPAVVKKKEEKKQEEKPVEKQTETKEETKEPVRQADPNTLFQKGTNTSKGTDDKPGDQGKKDGNLNSKSWQGGSQEGNGFGIEGMGNRKVTIPPHLKDETQREGKIVVEIVVDREGNVISSRGGVRGTTITDYNLINKAEEAARRTKFDPDTDAAEKQIGKITFIFKLD